MKKLSILLAALITLSSVIPAYAADVPENADGDAYVTDVVAADDGAVGEDGNTDTEGTVIGDEQPLGEDGLTDTENAVDPTKLENLYYTTSGGNDIQWAFDNDPTTVFSAMEMSEDYGTEEQYILFYAMDGADVGKKSILNKVELTGSTPESLLGLQLQGSDNMYHWNPICSVGNDDGSNTVTIALDNNANGYAFYRLVNPQAHLEIAELEVWGELTSDSKLAAFEDVKYNGFHFRLNHYTQEALLTGYTPAAMHLSTDEMPGLSEVYTIMNVPSTVPVDTGSYPVAAVLTNALSPANQAGYYNDAGKTWQELNDAIAPYEYHTLRLFESINYIETAAIGGEHFRTDEAIRCIRIPYDNDWEMENDAIFRTTRMHGYDGPMYGNAEFDSHRYVIYRDATDYGAASANGASVIYDRSLNAVMNYTCGHWAKSFTLDIPYVNVMNSTFRDAEALETLCIPDFWSIGASACSGIRNLREVTLGTTMTDAFIGPNAFSGCGHLRSVTLPEKLAYLSQRAFEDWCDCLQMYDTHQQDRHEYGPGQLYLVFTGSMPPRAVGDYYMQETDAGYTPFDNLTLVYPDGAEAAYTSSNIGELKPHAMISMSEYESSRPKYEWLFEFDDRERHAGIAGIEIYDTSVDAVTIPSEIKGYPVMFVKDHAFDVIPEATKIYNHDVYPLNFWTSVEANRVIPVSEDPGYYANVSDGTFIFNAADGYAAIVSYTQNAVNEADELKLPETVTYNGETYQVVAILENALSTLNSIGFDDGGYSEAYGFHYWEREQKPEMAEIDARYEAQLYSSLHFPDTVKYIDFHSIGGEGWAWQDRLSYVQFPQNEQLTISHNAFMYCSNLQKFGGLEHISQMENSSHRQFLYTNNNGGTAIYDRALNRLLAYTTGSPNTEFSVYLHNIMIESEVFAWCENLESLTINNFRCIWDRAFAESRNLKTICLVAADRPEDPGDDPIRLYNWLIDGTENMKNVYIHGTVHELSQYAFGDSCGCMDEGLSYHRPDWHRYAVGEVKVHFDQNTLPVLTNLSEDGHNPYESVTLVCPDDLTDVYRTAEGKPQDALAPLNLYNVVTESEYDALPAYEWRTGFDENEKRAYITGISLASDFDPACDAITIPSELYGYPIAFIAENAFANVPEGTRIFNNNVYRMDVHSQSDAERLIRQHGVNGLCIAYEDEGRFGCVMSDGLAAIYDYAPSAINENGALIIPETVKYQGKEYKVVAILENALSTLNSIGFNDEGYSDEYGIWYWDRIGHEKEQEINDRYQAQLFSSLYIPDTVCQVAFHSIGGEGCEWNNRLEEVRFPDNALLRINECAFMFCSNIKRFEGLPDYSEKDNVDGRFFLYTNENGSAAIYDKTHNRLLTYTTGSSNTEFTVDIPEVLIEAECFAWSQNLVSVTIHGFRTICDKAFSDMPNLQTLHLTASDDENTEVIMYSWLVTGSVKLRDIYINGTVDRIAQRALEDSCGCINPDEKRFGHMMEWHTFAPGELKVHMSQDTLPQVIDVWDDIYYPYDSVTFVCPDAHVGAYLNADGTVHDTLAALKLHSVITESAYNDLPLYEWHYEKNDSTKEIRIIGITVNGKFYQTDADIFVPSLIEDYPVTWMAGGVLDNQKLSGINIYDANVFGIAYEDWRYVKKVDGMGGVHLMSVGGFDYILADIDDGKTGAMLHLAGIRGYDKTAISDDGTRTLTVPGSVEFNGITYTVVGVLENGLSPFDAAGFDHRGYNEELDIWLQNNPTAEAMLEETFYENLILPDSIRSMSRYCIGEDLWNDRLKTIKLPHNPDLILDVNALHANSGLTAIYGLSDYADRDTSADRYFVYNNNGGQMIYDRVNNSVFDYTSSSSCTDFTVDIPNVKLENDAFSCSQTLEKVTVTSFRETANNIFASDIQLREINLTASETAENVVIGPCLSSDTWQVVRLNLFGDIDYIHQCAFEDWCNCYEDMEHHERERHHYDEGGLFVYFDDPTPPEVYGIGEDPNRPPLYKNVTAVCPDAYVDAYQSNENFLALSVYKVIPESVFDQFAPYEWQFFHEHGETIITGIKINHTFDLENDVIVIPSELGGNPVTWFSEGSLINYLPEGTRVISANVYAMRFPWEEDRSYIDFDALPDGSFYAENEFYSFFISEGMAAITGYKPAAVVMDEFEARTLSVPGEITYDGKTYPVVSVHPNALSAVYNAGYTNAEDFDPEQFDEALYQSYAFDHLVLPENLVQLAEDAVSGMTFRFDSELETIAFPQNPRFVMYNTSAMRLEALRELYNLPEFGTEGLANNFYFYRYNDGMGIYDRSRHSFHTYTVDAETAEFVLDIDNIRLEDGVFYAAHNLEKITVRVFREIGNMAFADCIKLREVVLESTQDAILNDALFAFTPNVGELHIPAGVSRISKYTFEDLCLHYNCVHDAGIPEHVEENHLQSRGGLHLYFYSEQPPEVMRWEDDYPLYDSITIHVPVNAVDAYREAMASLCCYGEIEAHAPVVFRLSDVYGYAGDTVTMGVYATAYQPVNSLALYDLEYDASVLELVSFDVVIGDGVYETVNYEKEYISFMLDPTRTFDDALLFNITFKIRADAVDFDSAVTFNGYVVKVNNIAVPAIVRSGSVRSLLMGDINMDGSVDIRDALCIIQYIAQADDSYIRNYPESIDFDNDGAQGTLEDAKYLFNYSMVPEIWPLFPEKAS